MKRILYACLAAVALVAFSGACSGRSSDWNQPLYDELLDYDEVELATFTITGNAECPKCLEKDIDVTGMKIEVIPADDPSKEIGIYMFDGLGPFTIPDLRYEVGVKLTLYCRLYTGGFDSAGYSTDVGLTVPENDGDVVAVTVEF